MAAHFNDEEDDEASNPTLGAIENDFDEYYERQQAMAREAEQSRSSQSGTPSSAQNKAVKKKFATLGDLSAGPAGGESSEDDDQDFFAGGEKSGLAVQNPDDIKKKIIEKAKR